MERRKRRKFSAEFKAEAVRLVLDGGRGVTELARELDLQSSVLSTWVQQAKTDRGEGQPGALTTDEKQELAQLRRENAKLREEKEILKKAAAFFAKESE